MVGKALKYLSDLSTSQDNLFKILAGLTISTERTFNQF